MTRGYPATDTFWLDPIGETARGLRRYVRVRTTSGNKVDLYTCAGGFHSAIVWIDRVATQTYVDRDGSRMRREVPDVAPEDPRWPTHCDCGYAFTDEDPKQTYSHEIYRRLDGGAEHILPGTTTSAPPGTTVAPPGAMWHAYWLPTNFRGEDGIALAVCLPDGSTWLVDSRAQNCTRPNEQHHCWVRHGDPRSGRVTVDKNGDTCSAGGGSVQSGKYHGFLRDGILSAG